MSQMPQIKAEVNKEPQKEKKRGGLLGRLFGGGSGGGAMGGAGGGLGGMAGGGLLATKTGLMALILVGTTVAGGIGVVGYRLFGPGQDQAGGGDNLQLFAPKPKDATSAGLQGAPKDGTSQSLTFASQANSQPKAPELAPAEAPKDAGAAGAAASADAAASANGPINAAGNSSNGVNKNLLKGGGKFGTLSSGFGSGGGGSSSASSSGGAGKTGAADLAVGASRNGAASGLSKGVAASGGGRAISGRKAGKALGQAFASLKDGRTGQTSYAAGRTFDGSAATNGANTGPEGGAIGPGGPGTADGGIAKSIPANSNGDKKEFKAPPTPSSKMAAPWQNAINTAQMMLALGTVLLFVLSKIKVPWIRYALGAIVMAMGVAVVALGGKISGGEWGQKVQGGVLAAAGVGLTAAAVMAMMSTKENTIDSSDVQAGTADESAVGSVSTSSESESNIDILGGINPYVLLGGGSALIGIATAQLKPPEKHPSSDFENGKPPDAHWFGYRQLPSETALKKMIA